MAVVFLGSACAVRNPDACCSNAVDCETIGFDEITPCLDLRLCIDNHCMAAECTTSADCAAPSPFCIDSFCSPTCAGDESCAGSGMGQYCAASGACVECLDNTHCAGTAPVCDVDPGECRACAEDTECSTGICLASEGVCAGQDEAVWVASDGADGGDCTSTTPCATVAFGLTKLNGTRRVLRIPSLDFYAAGGIVLDRAVYLDAAGTRIQRDASAEPVIRVINTAVVTIEGIRLIAESDPSLEVSEQSRVTAYDVLLDDAHASVHDFASELHFLQGRVTDGFLHCASQGTIDVRESDLEDGRISTDFCDVTIARNHFRITNAGAAITIDPDPPALVENNVIEAGGQALFISFQNSHGALSSSPIARFNTMINTSPGSGVRLSCYGQVTNVLSSNIVLAASATAIGGAACAFDHSVLDDLTGAPAGTGNITASAAAIFTDLAAGDLRPTPASGALGAADPAQVIDIDFAGAPRPQPAGSVADIGALEVP